MFQLFVEVFFQIIEMNWNKHMGERLHLLRVAEFVRGHGHYMVTFDLVRILGSSFDLKSKISRASDSFILRETCSFSDA